MFLMMINHFFPIYNVCPIARKEIVEKYPEIKDILVSVMEAIDTETIIALNYKVDAEGLPAKWLQRNSLRKKVLLNNFFLKI